VTETVSTVPSQPAPLPPTPAPLPDEVFEGVRALQTFCHANARAKGFHRATDELSAYVSSIGGIERADGLSRIQDRAGNRLLLIVGEIIEAHEEIRDGHLPNEEWLNQAPGKEGKPEGVPSEIADALIRILDFAGEHDIDLADVVRRKLAYNATREAMHGRQF